MSCLRTIAPDIVAMKKLLLAILSALCLLSCSRVEEAKKVVAVAEAMRFKYDKVYPDSTEIAEAAKVLKQVRWFYPTDYTAVNYYYGRHLLECGDYANAMTCFITAVTSHSNNYNIKGRCYCNMGLLCRKVGNYKLAYQMYAYSHDCFKQAYDTIAVMYAKDDMAFALAKMHKKNECIKVLNSVTDSCNDEKVLKHTKLIRAIMYRNLEQYDSSIIYANEYLKYNPEETSALLVKALSFSYLKIKDSAVYYAKQVMDNSKFQDDIESAYYILQHDDAEQISKDSINALAADRMDMRKLLGVREMKIAQAVLLLEQDLNRKPNYPLIIIIASALTAFIVVTAITAKRIRKKQKRLKHEQLSVEERQKKLERDAAIYERQRNEHLSKLKMQLEDTCRAIRETQDLKNTMKWEIFDEMCAVADLRLMNIATRLKSFGLNEREVRLCVLVMIDGFSGKEIAQNINYAESGIRSLKSKPAKKIGTDSKNLRKTLQNIAIIPD